MANFLTSYIDSKRALHQIVPLILTLVTLLVLVLVIYVISYGLNGLLRSNISLTINLFDVLLGMTVYLKTAIDFAIFIGRLMHKNPGWRNRVAIEVGTAIGNGLGTIVILVLWLFVKEVHILLAGMIFIASLVLFELAYGGVEHFSRWNKNNGVKKILYNAIETPLRYILKVVRPVLGRLIPEIGSHLKGESLRSWRSLLIFSFGIPFVLGLDDFAGYVPLFSVVNVFSFVVGVVIAHTILNAALFVNPNLTTRIVKNDWISFLGTIAFIGIALFGFFEIVRIFLH